MPNAKDNARDALLARIAKERLHLHTLETRRSDSLDFHDIAVWNVKAALEAAFEAGRASVKKDGVKR